MNPIFGYKETDILSCQLVREAISNFPVHVSSSRG